ncbi:TPA: hypothetical protein J4Q69_002460 [Escherichia coli]|nr:MULTISPECIES: hypothetical protein [Enterobacteriaceae]EBZ0757920.1 hypothetical protein [Salmonella enterica subsp. enterica serovar Enteritidis]ECR6735275.1 hypothetical protein [Salmonella enterica]EDE8091360.1 hypothetical protein [Salmonella enterica subsp. enterica serovar Anecho]EDU7438841.1 hypothetical protein [Salmonella enterica subsp. enterica]EDY6680750.1 hypothetical protein [Salmonella enterica subsp. enterica serovar Typhimurium]EEJ1508818.1 hypothetical protein [Salmonella
MEVMLVIVSLFILLINISSVVDFVSWFISKATSKALFIAGCSFMSVYIITKALVDEPNIGEGNALSNIGVGLQSFFSAIYLYAGIVFLIGALVRKVLEKKGLVKKEKSRD